MSRFAVRYDRVGRWTMAPIGLGAARSHAEVGDDDVVVRLGWAFHARMPRSSIVEAQPISRPTLSRGVHGWRGRWLANGAGTGLVALQLQPAQHARVMGVRVRLRELVVSLDDPSGFMEALAVQ